MIYIKPMKKAKIAATTEVFVKDVAEVFAEQGIMKQVENLKVLEIPSKDKNTNYLLSSLDVITKILKRYPNETVTNVGEKDIVIDYAPEKNKGNKIFQFLKIAFVCVILFAGSATAIMSFHSDAQIPEAFKNYYYIFFNEKVDNPMIIDLPYSIGLAVGIIVFFNHFVGKKMTNDPTPIQVEMAMYETDVTETVINILETEKTLEKEKKEGGNN